MALIVFMLFLRHCRPRNLACIFSSFSAYTWNIACRTRRLRFSGCALLKRTSIMMRQFFHLVSLFRMRSRLIELKRFRQQYAVHRGLAEDAVNGLGGNLHRCCGCKLISTSTTTSNDTVGKVESGDGVASSDKVGHLLTDKLDDQGNAIGKHQLLTDVLKLVDVVQLVVLQQQQQNRRDGLDDNLLVTIEVNLQSQRMNKQTHLNRPAHLGNDIGRGGTGHSHSCQSTSWSSVGLRLDTADTGQKQFEQTDEVLRQGGQHGPLADSERVTGNVLLPSHLNLAQRLVEVLLQNVHRFEDGRGQTGGRLAELAVGQRVADELLAHLRQKDVNLLLADLETKVVFSEKTKQSVLQYLGNPRETFVVDEKGLLELRCLLAPTSSAMSGLHLGGHRTARSRTARLGHRLLRLATTVLTAIGLDGRIRPLASVSIAVAIVLKWPGPQSGAVLGGAQVFTAAQRQQQRLPQQQQYLLHGKAGADARVLAQLDHQLEERQVQEFAGNRLHQLLLEAVSQLLLPECLLLVFRLHGTTHLENKEVDDGDQQLQTRVGVIRG
ncbi:hypothetical protein TYRP_021829 [Tyrophagus putrescentiae]|nr:hypothetical protein TYRP_021829 [Tyrophagus putrescentiae]